MQRSKQPAGASRREFLKSTAVAGTTLAVGQTLLSSVHAAGDDVIKIGLIGCGGRGTGAADNALHAAKNVKLVAMADAFPDRLELSHHLLMKDHGPQKVDVPPDRQFVGLDAYERVLSSRIDYVILATPPGFRPMHLEAAVAAGKHIFTEKPVATDATGIRKVLAAYEEAEKKKLCIAAGTQRRHQAGYIETMNRVHDGAIGDIVAARCYWNQGPLWVKPRHPGMNDLEYEMRNWYYFTWLCGDHIVEQHVHNLDVINWATNAHPVRAVGMGGREVRKGPDYGQIFDHFAIDYEYPNGVHVLSMCRQIDGCENNVSEALVGTKGSCRPDHYEILGENKWRRPRNEKDIDPYVQEHADLIDCIRNGKPINELKNVAHSTMTAIIGRMSTYTGKALSWDKALHSRENLFPEHLAWGPLPTPNVAVPGKSPLV
jgi:myo-inositol 2-dehydrogenase / D-chiro-inositol 1-dehydrogenase